MYVELKSIGTIRMRPTFKSYKYQVWVEQRNGEHSGQTKAVGSEDY